jgi:hypothetical protein
MQLTEKCLNRVSPKHILLASSIFILSANCIFSFETSGLFSQFTKGAAATAVC